MEKKTIGAFISALRRANGMTQRELGERLFVSDKTVSRWERDECTPDLTLIPVIADLFGITADELLRGERRQPSPTVAPAPATNEERPQEPEPQGPPPHDPRSQRQFRLLLSRRANTYKNLTLITDFIAIFGLLMAAIINLAFLRAYIAFGVFALSALGALISQLCMAGNARLAPDPEDYGGTASADDPRIALIREHNNAVTLRAVRICLLLAALFAFCLPLTFVGDAYYGLELGGWLVWGGLLALVTLLLSTLAWSFWIRRSLVRRELLYTTEEQEHLQAAWRRILGRATALGLAGLLVAGIGLGVISSLGYDALVDPAEFDNYEDFKTYMSTPTLSSDPNLLPPWSNVQVDVPVYVEPDGTVLLPGDEGYVEKEYEEDLDPETSVYGEDLYDARGELLFRYINRREYSIVEVTDSEDGLPIRVWTQAHITQASYIRDMMNFGLWAALAIYLAFVAGYAVLGRKKLKQSL